VAAAPQDPSGDPVGQACALLYSIVQRRPFGEDSDAVALLAAAHMLEELGMIFTFEPSKSLWRLLDRIRSNDASIDDVVNFVSHAHTHAQAQEEKPAMFERFTPRARQAMSEAKHAAESLRHNFIGTEHLLLGLLAVQEGVAAQVLQEFGVYAEEVRQQVEALIGAGPKAVVDHFPLTPRSKKVLELSLRHALEMGQDYIGTEHMLLGVLDLRDGVAGRILEGMGVTRSRAEEQVVATLVAQGWVPPSKKARRRARQETFPGFTVLQSMSPAAAVRNHRLLNEITTVIGENEALRAEVSRLRQLLKDHGIDSGFSGPGERPAS
jgi:ATP-dependent Clp protease ATP-binding subunit ClpC